MKTVFVNIPDDTYKAIMDICQKLNVDIDVILQTYSMAVVIWLKANPQDVATFAQLITVAERIISKEKQKEEAAENG